MKRKTSSGIVNRRASFDYVLSDFLKTGIVLNGKEVRAVRDGRVSLKGAFVTIRRNELWLNNASFSIKNNREDTIVTDPKKLLATKKQIAQFIDKKIAGYSIIPTKIIKGRYIKVEIALGKGKKLYDKRQAIKEREFKRQSAKLKGVR